MSEQSCNTLRRYPAIIRQNADLICSFAKMQPRAARAFIAKAPAGFLKALSLISYNLINSSFPLTPRQLKQITPYERNFRALARKRLSVSDRRKILSNRGGFLGALAGLVSSFILPKLVKSVFRK